MLTVSLSEFIEEEVRGEDVGTEGRREEGKGKQESPCLVGKKTWFQPQLCHLLVK